MTTSEVLAKLDGEWRRLTIFVEGIDPETFVKPVKDDWSPKDHLAHVSAWEAYLLAILERRDRFEAIGAGDLRDKETDEINDALFRTRRGLSADLVLASSVETHDKVRSGIAALSDSDLDRPRRDFAPADAPAESGDETLLDEIGWNTWGHYKQHREWLDELIAR